MAQVGHPYTEGAIANMKCTISGCSGEYEARKIFHAVRHEGRIIVIDQVPADVCTACDDVLLNADTVRRIEDLLKENLQPTTTVPLYEFA